MAERILSICIPTFNRAEILRRTVESYVNDPAFDERVEIVISDNCSSDSTMEAVSGYLVKHGNIRYNRLPENIGPELNMSAVLSMGKGLYLKLMNDTAVMKPGVLKEMLEKLESGISKMEPVFFYQNISFLNSDETVYCSDLNDLVSNVSFHITWILNFGIWRKDFESLEGKNRLAHLLFPHTDWTLRLVNGKRSGIIHFGDFYSFAELKNKGGYDLFEVFGVNYLTLLSDYLEQKLLRRKVWNREKFRLFRHFLMSWYRTLVLSETKRFDFGRKTPLRSLGKSYRYKPYFYLGILYLYLGHFLKKKGRQELVHS